MHNMSRSKRKNPAGPMCRCKSGTQKEFQSAENKRFRRRTRQFIKNQRYDKIPDRKLFGNEWDSPRDGKFHMFEDIFGMWPLEDYLQYKQELMRK